MGHVLDAAAPILGAVLGTVVGGPVGGAIGAGLGQGGVNYSQTHNIGSALKSGALAGAGSYIGGNVGNSIFGDQLGSVGGTLGISPGTASSDIASLGGSSGSSLPWLTGPGSSSIASSLGSSVGSALSTPVGQVLGSEVGGNLGASLGPQGIGKQAGNYPFIPTQAAAAAMPKSINSMSSLTPLQQASGLATQGVYGGGIGPQEQSYFMNLINRQLVDSGGQVSPLSSLSPIENSYLSKLGLGNEANSNSLLEALSKWTPSSQSS